MKTAYSPRTSWQKALTRILFFWFLGHCHHVLAASQTFELLPSTPYTLKREVSGSVTQRLTLQLDNPANYASISIEANNKLVVESLDIPTTGLQTLSALVQFDALGPVAMTLTANNAPLNISRLSLEPVSQAVIPHFNDITAQAGMDQVNSLKYGGPTIADMDNDGDYDFIVNNHNDASSKLYWNNGDGTVSKHDANLARWFMHDLHGTSPGDYDNDGDLDLVVTQGGGNGTNPSKANFYRNNNGTLVLYTGDVGIDKGGRGRGARWSDMDIDGDLDLLLFNETSLYGDKPQHFFYENLGDGRFERKSVPGIQAMHPSRVLLTDFNGDGIDDFVMYGPLSLWQGNGDFTFSDVTAKVPSQVKSLTNIMAVTDVDIDNDGDLDLYLARGKAFEGGKGESPSVDFDPLQKIFAIKPRGYRGVDTFSFTAQGPVELSDYYFLAQGLQRGKDYPMFLGRDKQSTVLQKGQDWTLNPNQAEGWPDDISENGMYFGYLGNGQWKAALVRNRDDFWGFKFTLTGVTDVVTDFEAQNRNEADILLRNDGDRFVDVSSQWNIPPGSNSLGVTRGDFNNDSHQDIFVSRWGKVYGKTSDYLLLNTGNGSFDTVTMHGANDIGGPGNGDMGQAFDFNLDGSLDLLLGNEGGQWYLYNNSQTKAGNYSLVEVGYSPKQNIDPMGAYVTLHTTNHSYRQRVGSAGEIFSQSLLNIVHFGLGSQSTIEKVTITWRNGETAEFTRPKVNTRLSSDQLPPTAINIGPESLQVRTQTTYPLTPTFSPEHADTRLQWQSDNPTQVSVNSQGVIKAVGKTGERATITAQSMASDQSDSVDITLVDWYPVAVESVTIADKTTPMYTGQKRPLQAKVTPLHADNQSLQWASSNPQVASINQEGVLQAHQPGHTEITAKSKQYGHVDDHFTLQVEDYREGHITISNRDRWASQPIVIGQPIELQVSYDAGSGNQVIASDEGGLRFWLRHFKSRWIPVKDVVKVDADALHQQSGESAERFNTQGLTPTANLPDGHFYQLRASFTASDGKNYNATIDEINLVAPD
ncbi:VCBS repeat-containing protein [Gilvimarinus agarilyticus]|uniref:FG-GAP-like repeat-containing protein n=1 Tax=Gilvimarinus sp. 2_MG-2023 TaxID=3062666 RepID=UPI001C09DEC0|nr:FG-GAP-like repeat-containing protein [Gilvimarinus sp. 2_MG-2023]MBU2887702.1 VCBS repeat-containing protein [Gilvimarinus agarilyticus]MDO6572349.1 FG-GAP-like repeat-containing protein [Gilvimarinus sp. 2_MG-2023]